MANRRDNKPVLHTRKHIARLERERTQTRIILFSFIGILVIAVGLIAYGYLDQNYFQSRRAVAKISGVTITVGEWQARVRLQRTQLISQLQLYNQYSTYFGMDLSQQIQQIQGQLSDPTSLGQSVLDQMIDEELIRQEAKKRGITVSPQEVEQAVEASYSYFPNGSPTPTITPTPVSSPTLSPETLALVTLTPTPGPETPTPTGTLTPQVSPSPSGSPAPTGSPAATGSPAPTGSPAATASATATQPPTATPTQTATTTPAVTSTPSATETPLPTATPVTKQSFDTSYKTSIDKMIKLGLTEDQVRQLYETTLLRQKLLDIVTADVAHSQDEVWVRHILVKDRSTAIMVRQLLVSGQDFSKLAALYSIDTGTKDKGGDLGWFPKGQMVAEFEAAAFSLKVGEISQPVRSTYGYHIIQVLAHGSVALDASAYSQAQQTAFSDWLKKLREQYKVETFDIWQNIVPTDPVAPGVSQ